MEEDWVGEISVELRKAEEASEVEEAGVEWKQRRDLRFRPHFVASVKKEEYQTRKEKE